MTPDSSLLIYAVPIKICANLKYNCKITQTSYRSKILGNLMAVFSAPKNSGKYIKSLLLRPITLIAFYKENDHDYF